MKITVLAVGARGDVQPLIALGAALKDEGFDLRIASHIDFESMVRFYGLDYFPVGKSVKSFLKSRLARDTYSSNSNYIKSWYNFSKLIGGMILETALDSYRACLGSDLIIFGPMGTYFAPHISEKINVPSIPVFFQPFHPTSDYPNLFSFVQRNFSKRFNILTHQLADIVMWAPYINLLNSFRVDYLGLNKIPFYHNQTRKWRESQNLFIYAFSETVIQRPKEWGENVSISGYFFLNSTNKWKPPENLVEFIESSEKPICIGFSSVVIHEASQISNILIGALEKTNKRAVLVTGWSGLEGIDFPDNVFKIENVPHDWLYPRMSAVVHHGGAGSTAAGLKSGVPSIVVPFAADQDFWGQRVYELGVGPRPTSIRKLNVDNLSKAIEIATTNVDIMQKAAEVGETISLENGVLRAVDLIKNRIDELMDKPSSNY